MQNQQQQSGQIVAQKYFKLNSSMHNQVLSYVLRARFILSASVLLVLAVAAFFVAKQMHSEHLYLSFGLGTYVHITYSSLIVFAP